MRRPIAGCQTRRTHTGQLTRTSATDERKDKNTREKKQEEKEHSSRIYSAAISETTETSAATSSGCNTVTDSTTAFSSHTPILLNFSVLRSSELEGEMR